MLTDAPQDLLGTGWTSWPSRRAPVSSHRRSPLTAATPAPRRGPAPQSYEASSWWQDAGPTVLAPVEHDSEHFADRAHSWALNSRVADLDAVVERLRGDGVLVDVDPQVHPNGRFAALRDPEGNPVQLWRPDGADQRGPV